MKKIKFILPALALVFALVSALATQANSSLAPFYGATPSNCLEGTLVDDDPCTGTEGIQCKVEINDIEYNAYNTDLGTTCSSPAFRE